MGVRPPTSRVLAGLTVVVPLAGCSSSASSSPAPATPTSTSLPSTAVTLSPTPNATLSPTPNATLSPTPTATAVIPTIGSPADDGARIIGVTTVGARVRDLTIDSPAVGTVKVRLLLPSSFAAQPSTLWPVLYLLHGSPGTYGDWWLNSDVSELTALTSLLVVMPYGGNNGWYSDWWNGGHGGPPKWETFHLVELVQLLERNWQAGNKRAIAGNSMGGYGAIEYAARRPGMFLAAASYSGVLDPLGGAAAFGLYMCAIGIDPSDLWGSPVAQADVWKAHDPTTNAAALKGTALYVAYGNGLPGPFDVAGAARDDAESWIASQNETFVAKLAALGIPVTVDAYGAGTHNWPYFQRDLHNSLPLILKVLGQ